MESDSTGPDMELWHCTLPRILVEISVLFSARDFRLILRQRLDDLSDFRSTAGVEYGQRGESLASGASQEYFHCSVTPTVTLKL